MTPTYSFKYLKSFSGSTKAKSVPSTMIINGSTTDYPTEILKGCVNHFIPQVESTLSPVRKATSNGVSIVLKELPSYPIPTLTYGDFVFLGAGYSWSAFLVYQISPLAD